MTPAVYDASERPITFDILMWLATVGAMVDGSIHFVILADRWRDKTTKDRAMTDGQKLWRVHHILAACCRLIPGTQTTVVTDRTEAARWRATDALRPDTFNRTTHDQWRAGRDIFRFRAPPDALEAIGTKFDGAVVLTIRQNPVVAEKNCRLAAWLELAGYARGKGHRVVLIPDTDAVVKATPLPRSFEWYPAAAMDVPLRAAVYERAALTMAMGAGPASIPIFMPRKRYALFLRHRHLASSSQIRSFEKVWGIRWGEQLPWAGPAQILDYRPDDAESLIETFDKVVS